MKKRIVLIISLCLVCAVCIGVSVWYFAPVFFLEDISAENVSRIDVFCGSTGSRFTVTDTDDVKHIVYNIRSVDFSRGKISSNYDGFSFSLTFFGRNGEEIDAFIVDGDNVIRDDPFFYNCEDGALCFEYLRGLEAALTEK